MKFSRSITNFELGTRAEQDVELPRGGAAEPFKMKVRPLSGQDEAVVLERARAYAKVKGVENPREGEPLYDLAIMVHTIAVACVDVDSPAAAREPAFDGGAAQVLANLNTEEISFVFELQQHWQDACSPTMRRMTQGELLAVALKLTEAQDDLPFVRLRPLLRVALVRTLANLLFSSPELRSQFSTPSSGAGTTSGVEPLKNSAAPSEQPPSEQP